MSLYIFPGMELEILKNGYLECDKKFMTSGRDIGKKIRIPVFCYLARHPKGNVLIDTGISNDYKKKWGKRLDFFKPAIETDIPSALKNTKIDYVINTHLHVDHCGNNDNFKDSIIIVQKDEYDSALNPEHEEKWSYPDSLSKGLNYRLIDGEFDLFNDGKIKIIRTPGHSRGHQSVLLKLDKEVLITGDACYTKENLDANILPGLLWNSDKVIESYDLIRNKQKKGVKIIFGHE